MRKKPRTRNGKELGGKLGIETIHRTLTMLQGVFTLAIQEQLLQANPVKYVKKPAKPVPKIVRPLTVEQVESLRWYFLERGDRWSTLYVVLMAYGGLRPSEPLALRCEDVRERTMVVHRTASAGAARHLKNRLPFRTVGLEAFIKEDVDAFVGELALDPSELLLSNPAVTCSIRRSARAGIATC